MFLGVLGFFLKGFRGRRSTFRGVDNIFG
jgi:hypothetical protein